MAKYRDHHGQHKDPPRVWYDGKKDYANRVEWIKHHGYIPDGYVVHHKNGDTNDNRIENLELMPEAVHLRDEHGSGSGVYGRLTSYQKQKQRKSTIKANIARSPRWNAPEGMNWCPDCNGFRPISEFGPNKSAPRGLEYYCRVHKKVRDAKAWKRRKARRDAQQQGTNVPTWAEHRIIKRNLENIAPKNMAWCSGHQQYLPKCEFSRNRSRASKVNAYCCQCDVERRIQKTKDPSFEFKPTPRTASGRVMYKRVLVNGRRVAEHRLIWEQVHGKIPQRYIVRHLNHDTLDNRIENLELVAKYRNTRRRRKITPKSAARR